MLFNPRVRPGVRPSPINEEPIGSMGGPDAKMGGGMFGGATVLGGNNMPSPSGNSGGAMPSRMRMPNRTPIMSYEKGTDRVPETGPAILHEDEAVLDKDKADDYRKGKVGNNVLGKILGGFGPGLLSGIGAALMDDKKPEPGQQARNMPSFKNGTDRVKKTGPAMIHEDEAVLNKDDAKDYREGKAMHPAYDAVKDSMGGKETSKKEIKEIHHRKGHGGKGHIMTHKHTSSEHPDEEHVVGNDADMIKHMMQHGSNDDGSIEQMAQGGDGAPDASGAPPASAGM